ncbi:glyoxal reductase [Halolactibacillus miurensis]|uniref:Aldo/keto reductase n=1 Tax=Halolactibacillus miurensis TaxID=306541 RepID=A0A1I6Q6U2_9BACI|nr:glyoxal reductase [Halolactibacillus miurensis]SFS48203.1 Aldo/keto reductase [Halolactibacillus miurensis]
MTLQETTELHNGIKMPVFGLGVYKIPDEQQGMEAITYAIKSGYRLIDTASLYDNEQAVGAAVRQSGIDREDIFVTSKVWNTDQGYEETLKAFDTTLDKLGFDYLDLYLIHWPMPKQDKFKDTWRALEKLYEDKKVRAIGVSNFNINHLEDLKTTAKVLPMVNQVECHPHLNQQTLRDYCQAEGIKVQAWSPLKRGDLFEVDSLTEIAKAHKKSVAQVILRWDYQHGILTIPKSVNKSRIEENADIFDFTLSEREMAQIDALHNGDRTGPNPEELNA